MTITEASAPSRVAIDLQFDKPFKCRNDTVFTIEPPAAGSRVTWTMVGPMDLGTRVMSLAQADGQADRPGLREGARAAEARRGDDEALSGRVGTRRPAAHLPECESRTLTGGRGRSVAPAGRQSCGALSASQPWNEPFW